MDAAKPKTARTVANLAAERFNRQIEYQIANNGGDYADAYHRVTGMAPPTKAEAKRYLELRIGDRSSLAECLKNGYGNAGEKREEIRARLVEIALHSPSESAAVAAAGMLAKMEGWEAPKQVHGKHVHAHVGPANFAEMLKELAKRNREPGDPEKIVEIEDGH
jgi:hypothetical protein